MIEILLDVLTKEEVMKMRKFAIVAGILALLVLPGCANFSREDQGTVLGGVLGGWLGSTIGNGNGRIVGAIAGTLAGGYLGNTVGRYMDQQDKLLHERALEKTLVYGSNEMWRNPHTGHHGRVEAKSYFQDPSSMNYCREYTETIVVDVRPTSAHGTACQEPDGSWRIMNR